MTSTALDIAAKPELACFFCSYPLAGLDEGHPCPECGRRSVPEDARREVQEIFDRPLRLFRVNLRVLKKYPYAWWWSLDRPGDARRATRRMLRDVVLCITIAAAASLLGAAWQTEVIESNEWYDPAHWTTSGTPSWRDTHHYGPWGRETSCKQQLFTPPDAVLGLPFRERRVSTVVFEPTMQGLTRALLLGLYPVLVFAIYHHAGVFSQLSRSLPSLGRARVSVVSASYSTSSKLIWQSLLFVPLVVFETLYRTQVVTMTSNGARAAYERASLPFFMAAAAYVAAIPWISVIRSDPTATLVQDRIHSVRIFVLYVLILPLTAWSVLYFAASIFLNNGRPL